MQNVDIRNISMGDLLCFVKAAEYNSFTRAAEHFHLTQSTVSKKISGLEQQIGLSLFHRNNKEITLTEAGGYLYEQWKELPNTLENDLQTAHTLKRGYQNKLVLGMLDSFRNDAFLEPLLDYLYQVYPELRIDVECGDSRTVQEMMLRSQADVVFTNYFSLKGKECGSLRWKHYGVCPGQVCMLPSNPLARKKTLTAQDLADSRFLCVAAHILPEYMEVIKEIGQKGGFEPKISKSIYSASGVSMNLAQPDEVFICDEFYREYGNKRFCFQPLRDVESGYVMIWDSENKKKDFQELVADMGEFLFPLRHDSFQNVDQIL